VRVLLVDDHTMMRHALAQFLAQEPGVEVVGEASDGEEGVRLARELRPMVVLMDVSMPGISGIEATQQIKAALPGTRVIGLSMHDMDGTREAMLRAGADDYLTKDGPPEHLLASIRRAG
jgi:DNA-binding NarL/FixJ family response regulator